MKLTRVPLLLSHLAERVQVEETENVLSISSLLDYCSRRI